MMSTAAKICEPRPVLAEGPKMADLASFQLSAAAEKDWDELNDRPARELPGLKELLQRATPFED
jgi:hypothetical protein